MARRDLMTKLADAGEEAIARLAQSPGADRVVDVASSLRDRMDELQRRVRGIDALEKRLVEVERRLDEVERKAQASRRTTSARSRTAASSTRPRTSGTTRRRKPPGGSTDRSGGDSPG